MLPHIETSVRAKLQGRRVGDAGPAEAARPEAHLLRLPLQI
ncbi:MAG: hypothetical protein ACR2GR_00770 [Rhodothermales bacterium]